MPDLSAGETLQARRPRLLEQVHEAIERLHYSRRAEESYVHWIKRFIYWSGKRHPLTLGEPEVTTVRSQSCDRAKRCNGHTEPGACSPALPRRGAKSEGQAWLIAYRQ